MPNEHLYGVVIRKGERSERATVGAEDLGQAFGKAAVIAAGSRWHQGDQEITLWVRRIHSPHGEKSDV